jgi:cell division protein FtsQ
MRLNPSAKRLLIVIGVLFFVGMILAAISRKQSSDTASMKVTILDNDKYQFITPEEIRKIIVDSFQNDLSGVPVGSVPVKDMELALENNGYVNNADVYIDAANHVNIKITQREPIGRLVDLEGISFYLDKSGRKIAISKHYAARVPIVSGFIPAGIKRPATEENNPLYPIHKLLLHIWADEFMKALVEQIYIDNDKEFTLISKIGHHKILLGTIDDLDIKFKRLKIFYREAMPYEGWERFSVLNVKFKDQVVATKR